MTRLQRILIADGAIATPAHVLEALSISDVRARPAAAPHSLYEEVWHLDYWQRYSLEIIRGETESWPEDNDYLGEAAWQTLVKRFLTDLMHAAELAGQEISLNTLLKGGLSIRAELETLAAHNAYHLGRKVLLRQLLGVWPPPSGGDTW